ncbi:hypothetical protein BB561_006533 [Smittium simulii]|uniref:Uncharacterized protein n=1 Tax=Smittium simulii TaxID=133385 RepID=A0A2T9Y3D1_9FUNG|nr:hypothetical protein BB561_006533 [Smittium simulii]
MTLIGGITEQGSDRLKGIKNASIWQKFTFGWMTNLIWNHGRHNKRFSLDILPDIVPKDDSGEISVSLKKAWEEEVSRGGRSLWRVLYKVFGRDFIITGAIGFLWSIFKILQAGALGFFIKYLRTPEKSLEEGIIYATALSLFNLFAAIAEHHYFFPATRIGYRTRVGLIALLFRKALNVSSSSMISTGEAVNLISNDVQSFESGMHFLNHIWLGPVELIMSVAFLWFNIGISAFVAVGIYLLMIPLQSYISICFKKIRANTVKFRDNRIKLLSDTLCGIEIVKLNAWENPLLSKVIGLRKLEYNSLKRANMLKGLNQALFTSSSQIVHLFTFTTLWALVVYGLGTNIGNKGVFQPENIFPCVSIFASMRHTMTLFLPKAFEYFGEIRVSIKRIEEFLLLPDYKLLSSNKSLDENHYPQDPKGKKKIIVFEDASFSWKSTIIPEKNISKKNKKTKKNNKAEKSIKYKQQISKLELSQEADDIDKLIERSILDNDLRILDSITFSIDQGSLCSIFGHVGSGKSSLCHAILGEMNILSGEASINLDENNINSYENKSTLITRVNVDIRNKLKNQYARVAYASQSPWIFCGTIKENILFGNPYEKDWFNQIIYACCLNKDFELFEDRENTIIGEKGSNLSGGQKARISLARAVYTRADLYVLDDPLSAVDPKVGSHLFENVLLGLLKDKTRILVTHQLQFVSKSDQIIVLKNGKIVESGPPNKISRLQEFILDEDDYGKKTKLGCLIEDISSEPNSNLLDHSEKLATSSDSSQEGTTDIFSKGFPLFSNTANIHLADISQQKNAINSDLACGKKTQISKKNGLKKSYLFSTLSKINRGKIFKKKQKKKTQIKKPETQYVIGTEEELKENRTSISSYRHFFRNGGSYPYITMCILFAIGMLILNMYADYYLSRWSVMSFEDKRNPKNVLIYAILIGCGTLLSITASILLYRLVIDSSNKLLHKMLYAVIYAPMSFFESQPLGRILNRFSKDQSNIDETLATTAVDTVVTFFQTLGALVFICMANAYLLVLVPLVIAIFIWLRQLYMKTSRHVKQIESITRSPVYSLLSETLDGLITVRAFASQDNFIKRFVSAQRDNSIAFFSFIGAARWLAFRLDLLNSFFICASAFSMLAARKSISPSLVALSMSYILSLVGLVQWCVRQSIEVEITFVSVERNVAYSNLTPEEPPEDEELESLLPPKHWPSNGKVAICDLNVQYKSSTKPVLHNITMDISPGEKVGIVGRTGAGKSSFVSSIFRLVEPFPNGCINIDGVNISDLRLNKLRSSISMIPQQPFLFEGSLRFNLDPWEEYSDEQIWAALEAAGLKIKVENMPDKLESKVVENGKNFSVGERQLISMCRAILQKKKLVVMDEATANVDLETDKQIQKSVHTHFKDSTVITIAHRLHTIIGAGYDKIAVFDHGKLIEFGHPHKLLQDRDSILSKMVADTGPKMEENLRMLASDEWNQKYNYQI